MDASERSRTGWRPWRSGREKRGDDASSRPAEGTSTPAEERSTPTEQPTTETALVTGCDRPVGWATARRFRAAGWRVYAAAPDPDALTPLSDAGCETAELDVTADANVAGVVRRVVDDAGHLDCLVTGSGRGRLGPVEDLPTDGLADAVDETLLGPHRLVRRVLPHMRERGAGTVVTVASALGRVGVPGAAGVCAPAAALATATEALRGEARPFGVDVVLVETGPVRQTDRDGPSGRASAGSGGETADATGPGARPTGTAVGDGSSAPRAARSAGRTGADGSDDARSDAYASLYDALDDARVVAPALGTVSPERVAEVVLNAASCTDPAPRYGVGRAVRVARVASLLPARWRDRAFGLVRRLP